MSPKQLQEFENMKKELADLKKWKEEKMRQQISFPLDQNSLDVLQYRMLKFANKSSSLVTADKSIKVVIDGQPYQINVL